MTINHYSILGFPPNGKDADGKQITLVQIRKAYRIKSLIHHPDKNPDAQEEAKARFREVQQAYELLMDEEKRAIYNESLEETADEDGDAHLFLKLDISALSNVQSPFSSDIDPQALVMHSNKGIDITELLAEARLKRNKIFEFATNNIALGVAMLNNQSIIDLLSTGERFVLLFHVCSKFGDNQDQTLAKDAITSLLESPLTLQFLASIDKDDTIRGSFIAESLQNSSLAGKFLTYKPDIYSVLTCQDLLHLAKHIYTAVTFVLARFSYSINEKDLLSFIQSFPEMENDIIFLMQYHAPSRLQYRFAAAQAIMHAYKNNRDAVKKEDVLFLGYTVFDLKSLLLEEMRDEFELFVFKFFYLQESFIHDASIAGIYLQRGLTSLVQDTLTLIQDNCSQGQPIEKEQDFHQNLLTFIDNDMDINQCARYFKIFKLGFYNDENRALIINRLLTANDDSNKLLHVTLFKKNDYYFNQALKDNRQLAIEFLNQDSTLDLDDIELVKLFVELKIDLTVLKEPVAKKIGAQIEIMQLLNRIRTDENVSYEDVIKYLDLFGYSSELLRIKTKDPKLMLFVLTRALERDITYLKYTNFTEMLAELFLDQTITDETILNLFEPSPDTSNLLAVLSNSLECSWHGFDWSLLNLAVNRENTRKILPAGLIYKFYELTQTPGSINSIVGTIQDNIDSTIYKSANFQSIINYDWNKRKETFEKIVAKAKTVQQHIKPRSYLASYLALSTNEFYLLKIEEYQELKTLLISVQDKEITDNEDYKLISNLLIRTKIDKQILDLLKERLIRHAQLYSALLLFIKLDNNFIVLPADSESINKSLEELKPEVIEVVTQYPTLAKTYLHIHKSSLSGDELSLMEERCGLEVADEFDDAEIITRLVSAKKMAAIMKSAKDDSKSFNEEKIDKKSIRKMFHARLFALLRSLTVTQLLDSKEAGLFILEMKKVLSQIDDKELTTVVKTFLRIKPSQIFASVVTCVHEGGDLLEDFVRDWLVSPDMVQAFAQLENNAEVISEYLKQPEAITVLIESLDNNVDNPLTDYYIRMINSGKITITEILTYSSQLQYKILSFYFRKSGAAFEWPAMEECGEHLIPQLVLASRMSLPFAASVSLEDVNWLEQSNMSIDLLSTNWIQSTLQNLQKYIAIATPQTLTESDLISVKSGLKQLQKFFPHAAIEELLIITPAAHQLTLFDWGCEVAFSINTLFNGIIQQWLINPAMLDLFTSHDLINGDLLMIVADRSTSNNLLAQAASLTQLCPLGAYIIILCENYSPEQLKTEYGNELMKSFYAFYVTMKKATFVWPNNKATEDDSIICQLVLENHLPVKTLATLTAETISYFNTPAIRSYLTENMVNPDLNLEWLLASNENCFMFYPAISEEMLTDEFLLRYPVGSIEYQVCNNIAESYDESTADKFTQVDAFFNDDFYKNLQNNIFTPLTAQIELLENDRENFLKSDSRIKICQLQIVRNEMQDMIIDQVLSAVNDQSKLALLSSVPSAFTRFKQNLKTQLLDHLKLSVAKKEISEHRNLIGSFLKGLVGVLLGISTLGLIYLAKPCRQYFFRARTAAKVDNCIDELERIPVQRVL